VPIRLQAWNHCDRQVAATGWDNYLHRGRLDLPVTVSDARSIYRISKDTIAADGVDR